MNYLLDTNVVSETRKRRAAPEVLQRLAALPSESTHISVLTLGELQRGVTQKRMSDPLMATEFAGWLLEIEENFAARILPVTSEIATSWGKLSADRTRPIIDTLLAATALVHDLTVVTRNERDFSDLGVSVLNPWR